MKKTLVIIPARGGSKGVPGKNIKPLEGKPLIHYTIDIARAMFDDEDICVSTDDSNIIRVVESYGLHVPFVRPKELATDTSTTKEVILHAVDYYKSIGKYYEQILILQPTSPFRTVEDLNNCFKTAQLHPDFELIVSVKETDVNPYYLLYEEDENGHLYKTKQGNFTRRQDCPKVWEINGAFYLFPIDVFLEKGGFGQMKKIKFEMSKLNSVDIDTPLDWIIAETILKEKLL